MAFWLSVYTVCVTCYAMDMQHSRYWPCTGPHSPPVFPSSSIRVSVTLSWWSFVSDYVYFHSHTQTSSDFLSTLCHLWDSPSPRLLLVLPVRPNVANRLSVTFIHHVIPTASCTVSNKFQFPCISSKHVHFVNVELFCAYLLIPNLFMTHCI